MQSIILSVAGKNNDDLNLLEKKRKREMALITWKWDEAVDVLSSDNQDSVEDSSLTIETAQSTARIKSPRFKKRTQFKLYRLIDESDDDVDTLSILQQERKIDFNKTIGIN